MIIETDGATVHAVVEDQGTWQEPAENEERGRGITLMRHLMSSAEIEHEDGGTRVTLVLSSPPGGSPGGGHAFPQHRENGAAALVASPVQLLFKPTPRS